MLQLLSAFHSRQLQLLSAFHSRRQESPATPPRVVGAVGPFKAVQCGPFKAVQCGGVTLAPFKALQCGGVIISFCCRRRGIGLVLLFSGRFLQLPRTWVPPTFLPRLGVHFVPLFRSRVETLRAVNLQQLQIVWTGNRSHLHRSHVPVVRLQGFFIFRNYNTDGGGGAG